jgi:hypothetical protein
VAEGILFLARSLRARKKDPKTGPAWTGIIPFAYCLLAAVLIPHSQAINDTNLNTSAKIPAAVTSAPAPGP